MLIEVEVVEVPLDYNIILGRNWIYTMKVVVSSIFRVIFFPFEDRIVTIDKMSFDNSGSTASLRYTIPDIDNSHLETENFGVGMYLL